MQQAAITVVGAQDAFRVVVPGVRGTITTLTSIVNSGGNPCAVSTNPNATAADLEAVSPTLGTEYLMIASYYYATTPVQLGAGRPYSLPIHKALIAYSHLR